VVIELTQPVETPNNIGYTFYPKTLDEAARYFRRFREDWTAARKTLSADGLLIEQKGGDALTAEGERWARLLRRARPPIYYWYREFYAAAPHSQAHATFCERVYGKNLCQDGFMEMDHLHKLLEIMPLHEDDHVLDMGCGNGMITEYIADLSGAHVFGIDYIPEAIDGAQERTSHKRHRLTFSIANMDHLDFPPETFDAILAVDTLYMPNDLADTVRQMKTILKPDGQMAIFYSHALWENPAYTAETLRPDKTPLAEALKVNALKFQTWDYTQADYQHALKKRQVAEELKAAFEAEGNLFLYENKIGVSGIAGFIEAGTHVRYLYHVTQ
jgi:SAM-dependent methyltransferase